MKFRFISQHSSRFGVERMCRVLAVCRSGYYAWKRRRPSLREPLKYVDPDGELPQWIVGGGLDLALQLTVEGKSFSEVSWARVGGSAVLGGVGGGLLSKSGKLIRYLRQGSKIDDVLNVTDDVVNLTDDIVNVADEAISGIETLGKDLKNLREITSGRLKGFTRGNTELKGGLEGDKEFFKQLTGQEVKGSFQRVVLKDGREIVFRATSKSKIAKVKVVDPAKKFFEKVNFVE